MKSVRLLTALLLAASMILSLSSCLVDLDDITELTGGGDNVGDEKEVTVEEALLFEHEGFKVTVKGMDYDSIFGTGIKLLIENDSDKDLTLGCEAAMVNDYMNDVLLSCDVAKGKKANETLILSSTDLKAAGIGEIGKMEFYFYILDTDYERVYETECIEIKTSAFDTAKVRDNSSGQILYNKDGVKVVAKSVDSDDLFGASVLLYAENTTDKKIMISCDDLSVNGFMVTSLFATDVYPGKYALSEITLLSSDLEENDISSIEKVEFSLEIRDLDSYDTIGKADTCKIEVK